MTREYISRAALLLQYYSALGELMEEGKLAAEKAAPAPTMRGEHIPVPFGPRHVASQPAAL